MRRLIVLSALLTAGCAVPRPEVGGAPVPAATSATADEAAIRAVRTASNAAIARRDAAAVIASMLPTYFNLAAGALESRSRDSTYAGFARQFADTAMLGYVRTPVSIEVSPIYPTAGELGHWVGRWRRSDGIRQVTGTYYAAWRLTPEGWRLQTESFVALSCTGSAQCPAAR